MNVWVFNPQQQVKQNGQPGTLEAIYEYIKIFNFALVLVTLRAKCISII